MSRDSSGEVYFRPFRPSNGCKFNDFSGKSLSFSLSDNDLLKDSLEIRITDMSQDFNEETFQQSRPVIKTAANDVMKHHDLDTLSRLLSKEGVSLSSVSASCPSDCDIALQARMKLDAYAEEVRESDSVPVIMCRNDLCMLEDDIHSTDDDFGSSDIGLSAEQDSLLMYSNDSSVLDSVHELGLDHSDENAWISDSSLLSLPRTSFDSCNPIDENTDFEDSQLVPVKVEDGVVYINVAPSSCDTVKSFLKNDSVDKSKPVAMERSVPYESVHQNRPSVISVTGKTTHQDREQHAVRLSPDFLDHDLKIASGSQSPLLNKSGFYSLFKPKVVSSKNSRSVLKASITGRQKSLVPLRPKTETRSIKEETLNSLLTRSSKDIETKNHEKKFSKSKGKKPQSLAVVAISSDKTKDLTEIVVSTSKGEQIFKGKTSELISATPSLWRINNPKVDWASSTGNYLSRGHDISSQYDDDETVDDQPVTDALKRLGIPPLMWVQNKPDDERVWFCPENDCKRMFPRLHLLKVHILGHYGVRPYKCDFPNCHWAFYTHFKLKRHKETHLQRKDFRCTVPDCGRTFSTIYNLNTHQKLHKRPADIRCPVENCSELFQTRRSVEFHLRQHGADHAPYICPYTSCQKRYYTVNSVNSHIRSHQHKDDEIRCQWAGCTKVFNKPCRLKAHMRTHTGDKPYPCTHPGCNWAFSSSSKLKRHQHKHTNVRKFVCPLEGCGKMFMRSEHLKEHILTHSSERTFKCPHPNCNVKFSAKSSLYVHSKKHKAKLPNTPSTGTSTDSLDAIPVNVIIRNPVDIDNKVESSVQNDITEINTDKQALEPGDVFTCPIQPCDQSVLSVMDLKEHVDHTHSVAVPIEIPAATQTLDLIPLLSEDDALVAELASMDPVPFESGAVSNLRPENPTICSPSLDNAPNDMLGTLPVYMDDSRASNNLEQVVICSLDTEDKPPTDQLEQEEELDRVLNPGSARSSITLNSWIEFKKQRQRQAIPLKHQRQAKRQVHQSHKGKKSCSVMPSLEEDQRVAQAGRNGGLSNLRAPLDVVLGAGLLGSGLLLPDDLAGSSDIYSSEDGILSMDSTFAPSTINLRDLE